MGDTQGGRTSRIQVQIVRLQSQGRAALFVNSHLDAGPRQFEVPDHGIVRCGNQDRTAFEGGKGTKFGIFLKFNSFERLDVHHSFQGGRQSITSAILLLKLFWHSLVVEFQAKCPRFHLDFDVISQDFVNGKDDAVLVRLAKGDIETV